MEEAYAICPPRPQRIEHFNETSFIEEERSWDASLPQVPRGKTVED
jgi:hypothetical protein